MYYLKFASLAALLFFTTGCSSAQNDTVKNQDDKMSHTHTETVFKKLSAPVQISHNFEGVADLGVMEDVQINVKSLVPGSKISLELLSDSGVQLFPATGFDGVKRTMDFAEGEDMSLQFQPLENGVHDIFVRANVYLPDGQFMTSSYNIPVIVGQEYKASKKTSIQSPKETAPNQVGGLAIMDAQETIED